LRQEFDENMELGKNQIIAEMKKIMHQEKFEKWKDDFNARLKHQEQKRKAFRPGLP
jgi:hypothetical protein